MGFPKSQFVDLTCLFSPDWNRQLPFSVTWIGAGGSQNWMFFANLGLSETFGSGDGQGWNFSGIERKGNADPVRANREFFTPSGSTKLRKIKKKTVLRNSKPEASWRYYDKGKWIFLTEPNGTIFCNVLCLLVTGAERVAFSHVPCYRCVKIPV